MGCSRSLGSRSALHQGSERRKRSFNDQRESGDDHEGSDVARALQEAAVPAMLTLARYAERWHDMHGRIIAETMRRDAVRAQKAIRHIELALLSRRGIVYVGLELQEAVSSYCLMRARLFGMYKECQVGLLSRLEAVL